MLEATPRAASAEEYESTLNVIYESMLLSERNGDYVEAENLQRRAIRYKKQWEDDTLTDMADTYGQATLALQRAYNQDLEECNNKWTTTLDSHLATVRETVEAGDRANAQDLQQLRTSLNEQLPAKVKESYQLLNLREMEHHMSKQKEYPFLHTASSRHISSKTRSATSTRRNWQPGTRRRPRRYSRQPQISAASRRRNASCSTNAIRSSWRTTITPGIKRNCYCNKDSPTTPRN
jgi:hypothetical protein